MTEGATPSIIATDSALKRCGRAFLEWFAHTLLIVGIIGCIALIEWAMKLFLGSPNPVFFGVFPVAWIFQTADLCVLIALSIYGVKAAVVAYRGTQ